MAEQATYFAPIPTEVFERMPMVVANHSDAFDVRVQAFRGIDGAQMFCIDVFTDPVRVAPTDRRRAGHVAAKVTSYFFDAAGGFDGAPQTTTTRYGGGR